MEDKFMLISVCDREILTERFQTMEDAQCKMHEEMVQWGKVPEEIFTYGYEGVGVMCDVAYSYGFHKFGGYANDGMNHADYDWLIVEL